jgi:diacylglycerol kinase (ATP)
MCRRSGWHPLKCALAGVRFACGDRSFRLEILLGIIFFPFFAFKFWGDLKLLLLSLGYFIILIAETINCAIERAVDFTSRDIHPLAKQAKDIASAAVLLALLNFTLIFTYCFFS